MHRIIRPEKQVEAGSGDIVVVGPETPDEFKNVGRGRLELVCVDDSPRIIQEELAG